ncbi:MAG: spore germination protein [Eubacteriales bacterium]|nr:spore germination protein [Eubacteriales bacterium]
MEKTNSTKTYKLNKDYTHNTDMLDKILRADENFDILRRDMIIAGRKTRIYSIDGLVKDSVVSKIMTFFYSLKSEDIFPEDSNKNSSSDNIHETTAEDFAAKCVPCIEVNVEYDVDTLIQNILSGIAAIIVDGIDGAVMMDTRSYPQRETSEPDDDKVLRGSKDGFVETIVSNIALIRRRIRDVNFTTKAFFVSNKSKSDVVVCYMEDKVDKKLLNSIIEKIKGIKVDSLAMNQQSLIEAIYPKKWWNPFPKIKYTERPDSAAANCIKGNIIILVDNSPSALVLPTSIFDITEEADDYYFPPITGSYLRIARIFIVILSLFITPLWLLAQQNPALVPEALKFVVTTENYNIPILAQLIILEIAIDGLRLAALNTPQSLSGTLGIIGAIALSEFTIDVGWFSTEAILYMAFVTLASFSQPSYELGYCIKFMRIMLLVLTAVFNILGFIAGLVIIVILLLTNRTISGKSYLYPIIPFNGKAFLNKVLRVR